MKDNCLCLLFYPSIIKNYESKIRVNNQRLCVFWRGQEVACFKYDTNKPTIPFKKTIYYCTSSWRLGGVKKKNLTSLHVVPSFFS